MNSTHVVSLSNRRPIPTDPEPTVDLEVVIERAMAQTASYHLDPASSRRLLGPSTHGLEGVIRSFVTVYRPVASRYREHR